MAVRFQVPGLFLLPLSRLGKRLTRCGASIRMSCLGSISLSNHFERRAVDMAAIISSLGDESRIFRQFPDFSTNALKDICKDSPPRNPVTERGNDSARLAKAR